MYITTLIYNLFLVENVGDAYGGVVKPWSLVPILCIIIGLALVGGFYFLGNFLRKKEKGEKYLNLIVLIFGLIFFVLEVIHEIHQYQVLGHYDYSSFPFQFCTMPLYFGILIPFLKGKQKIPFVYFLATYCFISGIFPLFLGQNQLCRWQEVSLVVRSFAWHELILALAIFLIGYYKIGSNFKEERKYFFSGVAVFFFVTLVAQGLNLTLHYTGGVNFPAPYDPTLGMAIKSTSNVNYADPDSASLLFISPFFRSNMVVFSDIWVYCGWFINYIVYLFALTIAAFAIYYLVFLNRKLCNKIYLGINKSKANKAE